MSLRRRATWIVCLAVAFTTSVTAFEARTPIEVIAAFGAALEHSDADGFRKLLPRAGKIRVHLVCLGPENGALSAGQVHAVLSDFLERGSVQSFKLSSIERSPKQALAIARVSLVDADGKRARVQLHLSLEPEGDLWVLREIRESNR